MESRRIKEKKVFSTPDNYFEQLVKNIEKATVEKQEQANAKKLPRIGLWYKLAGCAAAIALLFTIAGNIATSGDSNNTTTALKEPIEFDEQTISDEYIDQILNSCPIDDYTFYCYITDSEMY